MARQRVHVRRGDRVKVIAGNYKGVTGQVLSVLPSENRVVVEGVNVRKRHQRPSQQNPEGGIVTFEASIDASNVMLIDPTTEERFHAEAPPALPGAGATEAAGDLRVREPNGDPAARKDRHEHRAGRRERQSEAPGFGG